MTDVDVAHLVDVLRGASTNGSGPEPQLSDVGNGVRLVDAHGDDLRYCHLWGRWLVWDGVRFKRDDTGEAHRRAKDTARAMLTLATGIGDDSIRRRHVQHALRTQSARGIRDMLEAAQSEPGIPVLPDELDTHPFLLNVLNGTVDLRTGELLEHDREHLITKLAPVRYDPDAQCPTWEAALHLWLNGDTELAEYVRRVVGYALAGTGREQIVIVVWGPGANGKTTFLTTTLDLLGDYAMQTPTATFLDRRGDSIPNDVAALRGARLVAAAETGEGKKLNEALVKAMTGGDRISARFMRGEWFEFVPVFTPILATNHKPEIRGTDLALWRRIRLVPFTVTIAESERDPELPERLRLERSGILNWALRGCADWLAHGLATPDAVDAATAEYRLEQDVVGRFIDECCVLHEAAKAKAGDLYQRYCYWATANGEPEQLSAKAFGQRLAARGFQPHRDSATRWWLGVGIRHDEER